MINTVHLIFADTVYHVILNLPLSYSLSSGRDLDKKGFVGAILIDFIELFNTMNHDLLAGKLNAYGLSKQAFLIIFTYLKKRK